MPFHKKNSFGLLRILFLLSLNITFLNAQVIKDYGVPYIRNYSPKEYNAAPQNWCVLQDNRGIIYIGGNDGVLEYDGRSWRLIPTTNKTLVRSMSLSPEGVLFVGASNEFGYLSYEHDGKVSYKSLLEKVNTEKFGDIWFISSTSHGTYFFAEECVFRYYNDSVSVKHLKTESHSSVINDKVYVLEDEKGILCIEDGVYSVLPGTETFAKNASGFIRILPHSDQNKLFIISDLRGENEKVGIFLYDASINQTGKITKINSEIDPYIRQNYLYDAEKISENEYIIGTASGGIVSIDSTGKLKRIINKNRGLQNDFIHDICIDNNQNVWLALNSGNSFIQYNSNLSILDANYGLEHILLALEEFDNAVFIGSFNGIFYIEDHKVEPKNDKVSLNKVTNYGAYCFDMLKLNGHLLAASNGGILEIKNKEATSIFDLPRIMSFGLSQKFKNYIFTGLYPGFAAVKYSEGANGYIKIEESHVFEEIHEVVLKITSDKDGNLWLSTLNQGIIKLSFRENDVNTYELTRFKQSDGIPENATIFVHTIHNELIASAPKGIYKAVIPSEKDTSNRIRFVKENSFGQVFNQNSWGASHLLAAENKLWITSYEHGIFMYTRDTNGNYVLDEKVFTPSGGSDVNTIMSDKKGNLWISTNENVICYNFLKPKAKSNTFNTLIRKVTAGRDSVFFMGAFVNKEILLDSSYVTTFPNQPEYIEYEIPYNLKSIRIEFSSTSYINPENNTYTFKLKNFDKQWNEPTRSGEKEYTNLSPGVYTFMVKSINPFGSTSEVTTFQFKITAPWYMSPWAYLLYICFSVLIVWLIIRLYTIRLKKTNQRLEEIVRKRTKEIIRQKEEILLQKNEIEEQNLQLEKLSIVARETDNAVIIMDNKTNFEWVNEGFEKMYGFSIESLIEKLGTNLIDATTVPSNKEIILSCLKQKKSMTYQSEQETSDGRKIHLQTTLTPILNTEGILIKLIAIDTDISKIMELEGFKESMIQMIVHDLKNPLNNVIGFSSLSPQQEYANLINYSGKQMLDMVENILDIHKSERKELKLTLTKINLNFLVEKSIAEVIFQVRENKVSILNNVPHCYVAIDEELIRRVLINLLTNAIKYSPEEGIVKIRAEFSDQNKPKVILSISDEGPGIPAELTEKIFDTYFQVKARKSGLARSTGLGLTFCKIAVENHGGEIWVESNEGKGSVFYFTLPTYDK